MMFLGGDALEGPRHIWWNFVSSSRERIEQAKQDWKTGRFAAVPSETEFIPLPDHPFKTQRATSAVAPNPSNTSSGNG
mgnify:CR=1 FL=1